MEPAAKKPKRRRDRTLDALVMIILAIVVAKVVYSIAHWREAWSAIVGMSQTEWGLAAAILPIFIWWYCRN